MITQEPGFKPAYGQRDFLRMADKPETFAKTFSRLAWELAATLDYEEFRRFALEMDRRQRTPPRIDTK